MPMLKIRQAKENILPMLDQCETMSKNFQENPKAYAAFAESDYDILINTYGEHGWDLTDEAK